MERMKIRTIGLTLAFCFLGAGACLAADPQMGTWKLNEAKSKITPGTLKNTQVVYSSMFGQVKIKADRIDVSAINRSDKTASAIIDVNLRNRVDVELLYHCGSPIDDVDLAQRNVRIASCHLLQTW